MEKTYDHQKYEAEIYKLWEESGLFSPQGNKKKKPFTIIMPPPNANDPLHIGHAREVATQDILIRYHRMKGEPTLWLPGSDHAGIETQFVFEKKLKEKGKSRFDYSRSELYKMIWDYVQDNMNTMHSQLKILGASCDWSRHKFTLDTDIVEIVYSTFKSLYDDGLVYRGERIVNYSPPNGTSFSELEVEYKEQTDPLYYIDYGPVVIATTRPETIFADVAIAINPKDKKLTNLMGKNAIVPIIERKIPIIADKLVDPEYGTGALKVTPGHSATDFEIGQKHNLTAISVIDENGRMINTPKKYLGMKATKARATIASDLNAKGKIKKVEDITHSVGYDYKHKQPIEPLLSRQWFIDITPLAKEAVAAIREKKVKFASKQFEKRAVHWLKNLKDWNISRQIVWGTRIPAWRCDKCLEWTITDGDTPKACRTCDHNKLKQDEDTFDTWFSSGQWPFATLMTTQKEDYKNFYPTNIMDPSYDILNFWVIRMIMLGLYKTNEVPFYNVLLHGLVRDKHGVKISKSKGNVVDPIEMVEKYGADALRIAIVWGAKVESDNSLSEDNIRAQRNFANKIWNIARFVQINEGKTRNSKFEILNKKPRAKNADDKKILSELNKTGTKLTKLLDKYKVNEAAETIYDFIWNKFASDYLESTKGRREEAQPILEYVLQRSLIMAHPFMPFVTEKIWQDNFKGATKSLLMGTSNQSQILQKSR